MKQTSLERPTRFALVGAGTVGTSVAELLHRRGHEISAVFSRSPASAARAASLTGAEVVPELSALPAVDAVLLGTPDAVIRDLVESLASWIHLPGTTVIHFAGATGIEPLGPAIEKGGTAAALHPVQACPDVTTAIQRLPGSAWGLTVLPGGESWASAFVETLEGKPVWVAEEDRPLWHAAAVTISNGMAAVLALGDSILRVIGVEDPEGVLGPLAAGTLANARQGGAGATLTGPVVRGDVGTVTAHLAALAARAPELLPRFEITVRSILEAAVDEGRIDAEARRLLGAVLVLPPDAEAGLR